MCNKVGIPCKYLKLRNPINDCIWFLRLHHRRLKFNQAANNHVQHLEQQNAKKSLPRNIAMEIPVIYLILTKLLFIDYIMYYTVKRPLFQLYELVQFFSRISFSLLCFTNNTFTAHKSNIYQLKFTFRFYVSI